MCENVNNGQPTWSKSRNIFHPEDLFCVLWKLPQNLDPWISSSIPVSWLQPTHRYFAGWQKREEVKTYESRLSFDLLLSVCEDVRSCCCECLTFWPVSGFYYTSLLPKKEV